ncbi:conserved hypothetical protein [Candidatus Desulfarcum epimagneticum]|uniref:Polymerase beta nucleotidyltransferase domain-containing protein n=1 Tax=uncultured Desulfobacteraceae bacterium TaxID=218296 RepID=A0A484HEJ9_9BACT|nr:conserved hypothetical protein [uncultured Desulfobacteraceae bacterium]
MELFEKLKNKISRDPNIRFALVFGSRAAGTHRKNSDLDVALYFESPPEGLGLLEMVHEYSEHMGVETDIVILNRASAFLRHHALKHGVRLWIADPDLFRAFREKTMIDYDMYLRVSGMGQYD